MGSMTGARRSKSPTKSKSHLSKHFMLNRLMLLLGHSCISVIGADMYIWLYYKRVCLFNTIQCYIDVEQKSVTPPTCISLQIHLNTCIVWRTSFPLQNDGWGRGGLFNSDIATFIKKLLHVWALFLVRAGGSIPCYNSSSCYFIVATLFYHLQKRLFDVIWSILCSLVHCKMISS